MDLTKKYHDRDFNEMNILELVKKEPEWAAELIQDYEKRLADALLKYCSCGDKTNAISKETGGMERGTFILDKYHDVLDEMKFDEVE